MIARKNDIEARLPQTEPESILYDADGIYVAWYGVEDQEEDDGEHEYQLDFLVSNQSDSVFFLNFEPIFVNGFMITTYNALALEVPPHANAFTAATNRWIFDSEILGSIRFSGTFETIPVHMTCYPPNEDGCCSYTNPIAEFDANIVLNEKRRKQVTRMEIQAYCDECFTPVPREHAESRKPCPKCGNTFYAVLDISKPLPRGTYGFLMQREANMDEYFDSLMEIESIRITGITDEDYQRYIEAGKRNITCLEAAFDEMKERDKRAGLSFELPPVIPMPIKLPDMYMRHGHWDSAKRVYQFCSHIPYLSEFDFDELVKECEENRLCSIEIEKLVESGVASQKGIKKLLGTTFSRRAVNWVLGCYYGLTREKNKSDFIVKKNQKLSLP